MSIVVLLKSFKLNRNILSDFNWLKISKNGLRCFEKFCENFRQSCWDENLKLLLSGVCYAHLRHSFFLLAWPFWWWKVISHIKLPLAAVAWTYDERDAKAESRLTVRTFPPKDLSIAFLFFHISSLVLRLNVSPPNAREEEKETTRCFTWNVVATSCCCSVVRRLPIAIVFKARQL